MKKILSSLCALVGTMTFAQQGYDYQYPANAINLYSQDINVGNAKYIGVGGAVGALGSDINAVEQNPAGLGVAINSDVQITAGVSSFSNKTTFGSTTKRSDNDFNIQQFGGTFVFDNQGSKWNRFSVGVAYYNQRLDNYSTIGTNENIKFSNPDGTFARYAKGTEGYKSKFSVNFGSSYDDKFYLGLGLNFHESNYSAYEQYAERDDNNGNNYVYNYNGSPYSEIGQGFSLSLGAIYKVNHNVRLGAAYHSPVWYNVSEDFYAGSGFDLSNNTVNSYNLYSADYDMTRGGRLVGSLGFVVGKNLSIGADYTYHMNNDTKLKPANDFLSSNNLIKDYVQNSSEVRVGAEYRVDRFKVRAGYNYVASPFKNFNPSQVFNTEFRNDNNISQNNTTLSNAFVGDINRLSFGLGYDFGGFYIDAAYQYQTQKFNTLIGGDDRYYVDASTNANIISLPMFSPNVKLDNNLFLLTLGWQF